MVFSRKNIASFKSNTKASTAIMFAVTAPALLGFAALAVDVGVAYTTEAQLQHAVDEVALAALVAIRNTKNSISVGYTEEQLNNEMIQFARTNVPGRAGDRSIEADDIEFGVWDFNTETFSAPRYWQQVNAVRVQGHMTEARDNALPTFFGALFTDHFNISVSSTAVLPVPPSFHALSQTAQPGLYLQDSDLDTWDIVVNSTANNAFQSVRTSGTGLHGFGGPSLDVAGRMRTTGRPMFGQEKVNQEQPGVRDYMEDQPQPVAGGCNYYRYEPRPRGNKIILRPGTYCGLTIRHRVDEVIFQPGEYIFKDRPLVILNQEKVTAENVHFFFTGRGANLAVHNVDNMLVRAPESGEQKGVAIMSDRRKTKAPQYIYFNNSRLTAMGQIYLPKSNLTMRYTPFNGNCVISCVIADTMSFTGLLSNYFGGIKSLSSPHWDLSDDSGIVNPLGLEPSFRPYLIEQ